MLTLPQRVVAAEATARHFLGRSLVWGTDDCGRMIDHCLVGLGLKGWMRAIPDYDDPASAHRALKAAGYRGLKNAMDRQGFKRIAPLKAMPADILALPGRHHMPALALQLTEGFVLAIDPDNRFALGRIGPREVDAVSVAWRVRAR